MINFKLKAHIDESSVSKLLDSLSQEQRDNLTADDIMWKVSEAYSLNDETYVPIHAIGIKLKTQLSDAEFRQALEKLSLKRSLDLCVESISTNYLLYPILEIQSSSISDDTPLLRNE